MKKQFLGALALLMASATASHACDQFIIDNISGAWQGPASVRGGPDDDLDQVRCRLNIAYNASTSRFETGGRCASRRGARNVSGSMACAADGTLSGPLVEVQGRYKVTSATGRRQGQKIVLNADAANPNNGRVVRSVTTVTFPSNGAMSINVRSRSSDGEQPWDSAKIQLTRSGQ